MACSARFVGVCFNQTAAETGVAIFGFAEFLTSLALLVLVYNASDARYRFRVQAAPIPLYEFTFVSTAIIGFGSLATDLWFAERWLAPAWGFSRPEIQSGLGLWFLALILIWTLSAFVGPIKFGPTNAKRYARTLYQFLMRGSREDLDAAALELSRSSAKIIKAASLAEARSREASIHEISALRQSPFYAHDILLMIAHKRLCRHIVINSPVTAIILIECCKDRKLYAPLGQFLHQLTHAALQDRDSIVYHEGDYFTGLIGRMQSFLKAVYGSYDLIEASGHSALDLDHRFAWEIEANQLSMFSKMVLTTFVGYLKQRPTLPYSYSLHRALDQIAGCTSDLRTLDQLKDYYPNNAAAKVSVATDLLKEMIEKLDKHQNPSRSKPQLRVLDHFHSRSIFDTIAECMVEIILHAGDISGPAWTAWSIQHNSVWSVLFSGKTERNSASWIVQYKTKRLMFDEIKRMEEFPNYQGARLLRVLLNVLKWEVGNRDDYPQDELSVRRVIIPWVQRNFLSIAHANLDVAEACLTDSMRLDADKYRLSRVHEKSALRDETWSHLTLRKKQS